MSPIVIIVVTTETTMMKFVTPAVVVVVMITARIMNNAVSTIELRNRIQDIEQASHIIIRYGRRRKYPGKSCDRHSENGPSFHPFLPFPCDPPLRALEGLRSIALLIPGIGK
ncbi:hypothetical protein [Paracoccus onubensis]|uniref:hypothetical protein n=1 Tax=Paracoccus onubensis TaxID=1675788 RepID=UPI0015FEE239|nr:hypothetical protein [Paracoccus onubensis]